MDVFPIFYKVNERSKTGFRRLLFFLWKTHLIQRNSVKKINELCTPYASVVKIDETKLPTINEVKTWSDEKFANSLINDKNNPEYTLHLRQFIHISYKIAAEYGNRFIDALEENSNIINKRVTDNILERHIIPLFQSKSNTWFISKFIYYISIKNRIEYRTRINDLRFKKW